MVKILINYFIFLHVKKNYHFLATHVFVVLEQVYPGQHTTKFEQSSFKGRHRYAKVDEKVVMITSKAILIFLNFIAYKKKKGTN